MALMEFNNKNKKVQVLYGVGHTSLQVADLPLTFVRLCARIARMLMEAHIPLV